MPNWCSTGIMFYSENKESLYALKQKVDEIYEGPSTVKNDFGHGWLGDYAKTFYPLIDEEKVDCRGYITNIDTTVSRADKYYAFGISTETAWSAKIGLWYKILTDFYPDVKIAYIAEECSDGYYVKWDESKLFYPQEYYFDICYPTSDGSIEYNEEQQFYTLESIYSWIEKNLPFDVEKTENIGELEQDIRSQLDNYEGSDEFFCTIAEYAEIQPSKFSFYR